MPLPPTPPPPRRPSRPISRISGRAPPPPRDREEGEGLDVATPPPWGPSPTLEMFEIVRSLGRGSRGEVLEVRRRSDGRRFALKRSLRPLSGPAQRRHWLRECHAQRGAGPGPGLLPLLAAWEQRGHFHLLTPLCPAGSLGQLWRQGAARGGGASAWGGVVSPLRGVALFLWGVASWFWREMEERGVASFLRGVASLLWGVVSPLGGVASFLWGVGSPWRGVASPFWHGTGKRGVALPSGGVASSGGGVALPAGVTSPPKGAPPPAAASSPLVSEAKGGAAKQRGSSLANRLQGGVAAQETGVAKPNLGNPAISDPLATSSPSPATSEPSPAKFDHLATSSPPLATSTPYLATSSPSPAISEPPPSPSPSPPAGRPLAEWRLRGYLWDVLLALRHLHARPLAHGDLKPDNVLLDASGRCRLADFGLATAPGWAGGGAAGGGDPRYVAPEGLVGEGRPPGDIFSLGLTVAELAGERRLPGEGEGWRRLRSGGGGRLPPGLGEGLSPELRALLAAMLDPDPRLRPSAAELLRGEGLRGAGRWRPLTRLADLGLRRLEDWLEAVPALLSRFLGSLWGPRTPPRPPRADPWRLRREEEEEEAEGAPERGEGSRSPSPTPDPRRTLTFEDEEDEDPEPLPPPPETPPPFQ